MSLTEQNIWSVLRSYFQKNSIVANQLDSYNHFIAFGLAEIIAQEGLILLPNYSLRFDNITVSPPQVIEEDRSLRLVYPMDARRRDLTYDTSILCDLTETFPLTKETKTHCRIPIGRIPVMLRSSICNLSKLSETESIGRGECPNDPGGYFVVKGNERVLVSQMRAIYNQVFVLPQKTGDRYKWIAETRSMSDETGHSVLVQAMIGADDRTISFSLPYIKEPIPVGVVFKALGYGEEDIPYFIGLADNPKAAKYIRYILRDSFFCATQEDALKYISNFSMHIITEKKEREYAWQVVENETLPHFGISGTTMEQAFFLGRMIRKLLMTHIGERSEDDRDNYSNKRVETAGTLLYDIFRNLFKKYIEYIRLQLEKRKQYPDILSIVSRIKSISKGIYQCFSTGNWGVQKNAYIRSGVSQILDRMTYNATLSHLRRVIIPTGKEGKNTAMRQIHSSSFGFICPCECFHPDTPILSWDGQIKKASEIVVGDTLINEDGAPIKVQKTCSGLNKMFTVSHANIQFSDYMVTENHILTLKCTLHKVIEYQSPYYRLSLFDKKLYDYNNYYYATEYDAIRHRHTASDSDGIVDLTISEYNKLSDSVKSTLMAFKGAPVQWTERKVVTNPYLIGFTSPREIPNDYLVNSESVRLRVLAGIVDSIGKATESGYLLPYVTPDIRFLVYSLGFYLFVSTDQTELRGTLSQIPTNKVKSVYRDTEPLYSRFTLVEEDIQPFVGWQVEGTGRFLLGDFTVTHNTPEGQKIGVVLNFALTAKVTKKTPKVLTRAALEECKTVLSLSNISAQKVSDSALVYLNGSVVGYSEDPETTVQEIREKRHRGLFDREVSVTYDLIDNDIRVFCDEGRFMRPLFTLTDNRLNIKNEPIYKWNRLVKNGDVQYVDAAEIENSVIAMTPDYLKVQRNDFCEIHPSVMLGIMAAMIPFADHSQSPRNCYQCLWVEEKVLMASGTYKRIADIEVGEEVVTVDPVTCDRSITKVVNRYVKKTDKQIVKVTSLSGRELLCTEDHPILTEFGWRKAGDLSSATRICVFPKSSPEPIYQEYLYYRSRHSQLSYKNWSRFVTRRGDALFVPVESVEYCENVLIADITTESDTHSFITGQGICVHNSSMGKQALGIPTLSYNLRTDTLLHVLHYPQKPIVFTKPSELIGINEMPSGLNAIVAIACYSGFNQEDSLMVNHSAVQRGLFSITSYHTIDASEKKLDTYSFEEICLPPRNSESSVKQGETGYFRRKNANYSLLDEHGIVRPRERFEGDRYVGPATVLKKGDVIIGKVSVSNSKTGEETRVDASVVIQPGEEGIVDRVYTSITPNGYKLVKVVIRVTRTPTLGDKLACYDSETELLTSTGWTPVGNVTTAHKIACLVDKKQLVYLCPTETQSYDYSGDMYTVETDSINIRVTPNHRLFVSAGERFYTARADSLADEPRLIYNNSIDEWKGNSNYMFTLPGKDGLPDKSITLKEWCVFFGLWVSKRFVSDDPRISSYFDAIRDVPEWCFTLDKEHSRILLQEIIGCYFTESSIVCYSTTSKLMADSVQRLCLHAGIACNYTETPDRFSLVFSKTAQRPTVYKEQVHWTPYNGQVYCCTVPTDDGVVFVRRRGKSYWCGNSKSAQKGTIGMIYSQEDMPFTAEGITPDIIINPLCLGKDSFVTLIDNTSERIDKIVENQNAYTVKTVDPADFKESNTSIHSPFKIVPRRTTVRVKTLSGREIICTDDHPFLTGKDQWRSASELTTTDMLTIVHSTKRLDEHGFTPLGLSERRLQIAARLLGRIEADGFLGLRSGLYQTLFYVDSESDAMSLSKDMRRLGFTLPNVYHSHGEKPYVVEGERALGSLLHRLGAHRYHKALYAKRFPDWLFRVSPEVKRQFLSGLQGGIGSSIRSEQGQIILSPTLFSAHSSVIDSHLEYLKGIQQLFSDLNISTDVSKNEDDTGVQLVIENSPNNIERYSDVIFYAYAVEKERASRRPIEALRLLNRGYLEGGLEMRGEAVAVYVESVETVDYKDLVYDFSTVAETHSFVANSIVVHNCMPSRMTINQLIECALGKECVIAGRYGDATPFTQTSVNVADKLVGRITEGITKYGFQSQGWERMYNGMTGEMIHSKIFIGPTYYQRLKHMVDDKMHARAQGHVTMLVRQPLEGARSAPIFIGQPLKIDLKIYFLLNSKYV